MESSDRIRAEAEQRDRLVKIGLLVVSVVTLVVLIWSALWENVLADWRGHRRRFQAILEEEATNDLGRTLAANFELGMEQLVLTDLDRIDRCIVCHAGIDDPRMRGRPQPYTAHPGDYLKIHDPGTFGCTICHQGQGLATGLEDAHGTAPFWDRPLLPSRYVKSTCTRCHSRAELFGPERLIDAANAEPGVADTGTQLLERGWEILEGSGCLGCHTLEGRGGTIGPDLSFEGDKTAAGFDFSHFTREEPHDVIYWLRAHFADPKAVVPATVMPDYGFDEPAIDALVALVLSFREPVAPFGGPGGMQDDGRPRSGARLYGAFCSSCHGPDGKGGWAPEIRTPALNNSDALAVTDRKYLRLIIKSGRSGTRMQPWGPDGGNLTDAEIERIVSYIRGWSEGGATYGAVQSAVGDPRSGAALYHGLCASCHGHAGDGGIGTSLNAPQFHAVATDRFLIRTLLEGRPGTAMPTWSNLPPQSLADIVAYLRTWRPAGPSFPEVRQALAAGSRRDLVRMGDAVFGELCASCHGNDGEGGIGVRLHSDDLLANVGDEFLYRAIVEGRPSTAMPSWRHLSARTVAALIARLRDWQERPAVRQRRVAGGDHIIGELYYRMACQRCHGESGAGAAGPQITNRVLLDSVSDHTLYQWIAYGRTNTAMKGFLTSEEGVAQLDPERIRDIIAYLRYASLGAERPPRRLRAGIPSVGEAIFTGTCGSCHGSRGEGLSAPQLNNPVFLDVASDGYIAATMVLGRSGTPMRSMVHGRQGIGQLPPDRIEDVVAYIRQWGRGGEWEQPRLAVEMSARAISEGARMFARYCAGCHGPNGRGELDGPNYFAPSLNNPEFLDAASDGFLLATIARGRARTPMRPFGEGSGGIASLKPEQISDIVSYIRSWHVGAQK
jgi:mono/diheme cytochrome c family protein